MSELVVRPPGRPAAGGGAAAVLLAFMVAIPSVPAAIGPEMAAGFTSFVAFLPYPSSAFVPVDTVPSWLPGSRY